MGYQSNDEFSVKLFLRKNLRTHTLNRFVRVEKKKEKRRRPRKLANLILKCLGFNFMKNNVAWIIQKIITTGLWIFFYKHALALPRQP